MCLVPRIGPGTLILRPRVRWRCSMRRRRRYRRRRCHGRQRPPTTIPSMTRRAALVPAGSAEVTIPRGLEVGIRVEVETRVEAGLVRTTEPGGSCTGGLRWSPRLSPKSDSGARLMSGLIVSYPGRPMLLIAFLKPRPTPNMGRNHQRPALGAFQNVVLVEGDRRWCEAV